MPAPLPWRATLARLRDRVFPPPPPPSLAPPPPDTKAHRASPFVTVHTPRSPQWAPRDYAAFAREGFMQNAIVYRSVRMIAEAAGSVPFLLYDGDTELDTHPLLQTLRHPHGTTTTPDLIEQLVGFLLISGNSYIEAISNGSDILELHALRPDRMQIVPGPDGWPDSFVYSIDGQPQAIDGEALPGIPRILHLKLFHPLNDHYGMSPIEAASQAIDLHNAASSWNKSLLDNSARPSGALVYTARDGNLTTDQFERLKRELESGFQGSLNAGRPLLLEGGLDWKAMSLSPKDMDFLEARNAAAREIALAIGVPPQLLGIPGDNTYANYQEANRAFWRHTVIPLVNRIAAALTAWLAKPHDAAFAFRPDYDQVDALNPERDSLWSRLNSATFLTQNEKRAAAGYGAHTNGDALKRHFTAFMTRGGFNPDTNKFNPNHDSLGRFTSGEDDDAPLDDSTDGPRDPIIEVVAGRPVNLQNEEDRGGHTIKKHVGKKDDYLLERLRNETYRVGTMTIGLKRAGTFPSIEAAEKLTNAVLALNEGAVARIVRGRSQQEYIEGTFAAPTGREAYRKTDRSTPYFRDTFGVAMWIGRDQSSPNGYIVRTAYPMNPD